MIVRNESKNLPRLFASLQGHVDYYVISDTGSTDDTIETIRALGARYGIPGEVTAHPWVDFAHNRNLALADALASRQAGRHQCQWLMIIDADEELISTRPGWKEALSAGHSYYAYKKTDAASWAHTFLLWVDGQSWHWEGKVHNYLVNENIDHPRTFLLDPHIRYHFFEGAKSHGFADPHQKALEDVKLMEKELRDLQVTADNLHRFYQLAYCYRYAQDDRRALSVMRRVLESGFGSVARKYTARIFMTECLGRLNADADESIRLLDAAILLDPLRKEAMYYKALILRRRGRKAEAMMLLEQAEALPWPKKGYFMWEESVYAWKIDYELAFLYYCQGNFNEASAKISALKSTNRLPDQEKAFLDALQDRIPAHM